MTVGDVKLGSEHPIVRQTMTTSDTRDVEATVAEVRRRLSRYLCFFSPQSTVVPFFRQCIH